MSSEKEKKKKSKQRHEHKRVCIIVEKELLDLFYSNFKDVNFSYFVEICMKQALESIGVEYLTEEDEILMGKIKANINRIKSILKHEKFKALIDAGKAIEIASKEGDLARKVSLH